MSKKRKKTLPAKVKKIIKPRVPGEPEKAQIDIQKGADDLYREIRVENSLTDEKGDEFQLKQDADVDVTVEAEPEATKPKESNKKPRAQAKG